MKLPLEIIRTGVCEETGLRESYEDEYAIYRVEDLSFFSAEIYDGHGGNQAAMVAAEMLTPHFIHLLRVRGQDDPVPLIEEAYLTVDSFLTERRFASGTTAATFYIMGERFYAANVGDTRIIIGTKEGVRILTRDHKPDAVNERSRIEKRGGMVITYDIPRVQGILAISRALGDTHLKPFVIAYPRIVEGCLSRENDYAILACDGVWDVLDAEDVIEMARKEHEAQIIAREITRQALVSGSTDNITVIVVDLREYTRDLKNEKMEILRIWESEG